MASRHDWETLAIIGRALGVSRERLRQTERVREACDALRATGDPALRKLADNLWRSIEDGTRSVNWVYRSLVRGDDTRALYVRVPAEVWDRLDDVARQTGRTKSEWVTWALTQIFGYQDLGTREQPEEPRS